MRRTSSLDFPLNMLPVTCVTKLLADILLTQASHEMHYTTRVMLPLNEAMTGASRRQTSRKGVQDFKNKKRRVKKGALLHSHSILLKNITPSLFSACPWPSRRISASNLWYFHRAWLSRLPLPPEQSSGSESCQPRPCWTATTQLVRACTHPAGFNSRVARRKPDDEGTSRIPRSPRETPRPPAAIRPQYLRPPAGQLSAGLSRSSVHPQHINSRRSHAETPADLVCCVDVGSSIYKKLNARGLSTLDSQH
jgi:hypothetical protein